LVFATASRLALEPTQPPIQWVDGSNEADHSPPSSATDKNVCSYTSTPQHTIMWCLTKQLIDILWYLVKHTDNFTLKFNVRCILVTCQFLNNDLYLRKIKKFDLGFTLSRVILYMDHKLNSRSVVVHHLSFKEIDHCSPVLACLPEFSSEVILGFLLPVLCNFSNMGFLLFVVHLSVFPYSSH
jgi:hypothetical protein